MISSVPEARFLYNQVSSTEFSEINGSSSETVLVLNPLFDPSLSGYMMAQWGRNFALFHTGVNDMCLCGRDAVLENSNQGIEGVFGDTKHDPDLLIASRDPATFLHYLAKRQRESSGKLVNQLRRLDQIVEFKNRKIKTEESYGNAEDERENKVDVGWAKKIDRREEILKELNDLLESEGCRTETQKYNYVSAYGEQLGMDKKFMDRRSFYKWINVNCKNKRLQGDHKAWGLFSEVIKSIRIRNGDIPPNSPEMTGDSNVLTQSPSESCHNDDIQWTVADVMEVMKDNAFDELGMMVKSVRDHRGEYDLLIEQRERRCPKRISDNINHFVNEVLSKGTGSVFAKEDDKFISKFTLRDSEMQGTTDNYKDGSSVIVTDGMKIIGKNVPSEEKAWVSRYSQVVKTESCEVFDKVFDLIPATLRVVNVFFQIQSSTSHFGINFI